MKTKKKTELSNKVKNTIALWPQHFYACDV